MFTLVLVRVSHKREDVTAERCCAGAWIEYYCVDLLNIIGGIIYTPRKRQFTCSIGS